MSDDTPDRPEPPRVYIPPEVSLVDHPRWEQHIWQTPGLTVKEREFAIFVLRIHRGDMRFKEDVDALAAWINQLKEELDGP